MKRNMIFERYISSSPLFWIFSVLWVVIVSASVAWNWIRTEHTVMELAYSNACMALEKDIIYRKWAAMNGGVYVPVTEKTPPNPYLSHIPQRDVVTPEGTALTLVNPSYMTRQVSEILKKARGIYGHITSLDPLRPENKPDQWEKKAMESFISGSDEVSGVATIDGKLHMRLMRPLRAEPACFKCHPSKGLNPDRILGGLSISLPMGHYAEVVTKQRSGLFFGHLFIAVFGLASLFWGIKRFEKSKQNLLDLVQRYELVLAGSVGGVWDWDIKNHQILYSPTWKSMRGYNDTEIDDKISHWSSGIHPDDRDRVMAAVDSHFEEKTDVFDEEYRVRKKDGTWIWIHDRGKAFRNDQGEIIRMAGSEVDVSDRKNAMALLESSESKFRRIFENSPIAIELYDASGRLVAANPACLKLFGIETIDYVLGFELFQDPNLPPDVSIQLLNCQTVNYRSVFDFETIRSKGLYHTSRKGQIHVDVLITPFEDKENKGFLVHVQDITALTNEEKEKGRLISRLKQSLAEVKDLSGLLPICASCHRIRDDKGYWNRLETYIQSRTRADFTHSICPECIRKLYPEIEIE